MLTGYIKGQDFQLDGGMLASGSINYISGRFTFSPEWDDVPDRYIHFWRDDAHYSAIISPEGNLPSTSNIHLSAGPWSVYIIGERSTVDGESVEISKRITTTIQKIWVARSGLIGGEPFPEVVPGIGEQIIARATAQAVAAGQSATAAGQSADEAAEAADAAGQSATAAGQSADEAAEAADAAGQSATAAGQSASDAAQSATTAGQSATAAGQSATEAGQSASDAAQSATAAGQSASDAAQSATAAGQSASDAAQSATAAGQSATAAGQSASDAAQSATAAGQSATAAGQSADEAAEAAEAAAQSATAAGQSADEAAEAAQIAIPAAISIILAADGWHNNTYTANVPVITVQSKIIASPSSVQDSDTLRDNRVWCNDQGEGIITFICDKVPANSISLNLLIFA